MLSPSDTQRAVDLESEIRDIHRRLRAIDFITMEWSENGGISDDHATIIRVLIEDARDGAKRLENAFDASFDVPSKAA